MCGSQIIIVSGCVMECCKTTEGKHQETVLHHTECKEFVTCALLVVVVVVVVVGSYNSFIIYQYSSVVL